MRDEYREGHNGKQIGQSGNMMILDPSTLSSSDAWIGSIFGHEGQHFENSWKTYKSSELWRDELSASEVQLGIGKKIGFTKREIDYLQNVWMTNKEAMQQHMVGGVRH